MVLVDTTSPSGFFGGTATDRLVVLGLDLEVALRVVAGGADLWCLLADDDMSAVGALPDDIAFAREDHGILDVL